MRALIIIAGAALALGGCGKNDQSGNIQNADDKLSADSIVSNDVTAIDAVTGDASNMAADVDMNFGNLTDSNASAPESNGAAPAAKPKPKTPRETTPSATTEPTNTAISNSQ